jgi:hypothetical protein
MSRNRTIDAFRGLAIVGMVFFTLTLKLSRDLPEPLRHNAPDSLHLGDFVLPMFLFASGLSLAFFLKKRVKQTRKVFFRDVIARFGKLLLVAVLLSYFSAGVFLGMDEVMLSALLFLACIGLSKLNWKIGIGIVFLIDMSYLALIETGWTSIFEGHYLGGYPAALYYLPVMYIALLIGEGIISDGLWCKKNKITIISVFFLFILSWVFAPIEKRAASPSFMMLSILFCFLIFVLLERAVRAMHGIEELEYLGRKPFRYWIMMWVFFLIPLILYAEYSELSFPLDISWSIGIILSICVMLLLWLMSIVFDILRSKMAKAESDIE